MELSERKIRILENIINDYIATAEPVGSRTLSKKYDMGLSSATIRNEMSDLEEMGYIIAPHASAGRVPSDMGYRLFVDRLLRGQEKVDYNPSADMLRFTESIIESIITNNINQIDHLMKETAKAISLLTNYTAVVSEGTLPVDKVGRLQLIPLDENSILLTAITASKKVKNYQIRILGPDVPDYDELLVLSRALNAELTGLVPDELDKSAKKRLKAAFRKHGNLCDTILSIVASLLTNGDKRQVYTVGIKNILAFPEFYDHSKAHALFEALEERDYLISLLDLNDGANTGVSVVIGRENALSELRDCSVVKTTYSLGLGLGTEGGITGDIAIIGPTRMDYSQTVKVLQNMSKHIEGALRALENQGGS